MPLLQLLQRVSLTKPLNGVHFHGRLFSLPPTILISFILPACDDKVALRYDIPPHNSTEKKCSSRFKKFLTQNKIKIAEHF